MIQPNYAQLNPYYPQPGGANAVGINIFNPQAYGAQGGAPQVNTPDMTTQMYQMPQANMYGMPQANMYGMPQASAFQQPVQNGYYQQFMPVQNPMNAVPVPQMVQQMPQAPAAQMAQQIVAAPTPQVMPESVMPQAQAVQVAPEAPQVAPATAEVNAQPVEVKEEKPAAPAVNVDGLVNNLKSTDNKTKLDAINEIAKYAQETPEVALQVVSEPVMTGLINIINEDTSKLQGPSKEQLAIEEKINANKEITPQENEIYHNLSPRDAANKNRIFSLYTLAMIQKLQRDELDQYVQAQKANGETAIAPIKMQELMGYNNIVNVINSQNERPEVKVAAIQALQYIANPEDKATVQQVLQESLASKVPGIKAAADEAMAKFNA